MRRGTKARLGTLPQRALNHAERNDGGTNSAREGPNLAWTSIYWHVADIIGHGVTTLACRW